MLTHLFIFLAAFINGMTDTMCFNEDNSLFTYWGNFWLPRRAYGKYPKVLGATMDGFHIFKFVMIVLIVLACINYVPVFGKIDLYLFNLNTDIISLMLLWMFGFELSRKIFKTR